SGENVTHEVLADQSGKFSVDIDLETDISYIGLYTSVNLPKTLIVKTINGGVTNIDIDYNSNRDIKNVEVMPDMNEYDMTRRMEVLIKMIDYTPDTPGWVYPRLFDKSIDEFLDFANSNVSKRMTLFVDNDNLLSKEFKEFIAKDYRLFLYTGHVFDYEAEMKRNYRNSTKDTVGEPGIQKIDCFTKLG